jgi:hypothetical protein
LLLEQGKYEEARKHLDVSLEAIQSITGKFNFTNLYTRSSFIADKDKSLFI